MIIVKCSKCYEPKPATSEFFHRNKNGKNGLQSICKICRRSYMKEYARRPVDENYKEKNKKRFASNRIVHVAIRGGILPPANECECADCDEQADHYHHEDYDKPLEVMALCIKCHRGKDIKKRKREGRNAVGSHRKVVVLKYPSKEQAKKALQKY